MDEPKTGGDLLRMVREKYGTEEVEDLSRLSGISRTTIENWERRPTAELRKQGRDHYRRIFGSSIMPSSSSTPTITPAQIADLIEALHSQRQATQELLRDLRELIRQRGDATKPERPRRRA